MTRKQAGIVRIEYVMKYGSPEVHLVDCDLTESRAFRQMYCPVIEEALIRTVCYPPAEIIQAIRVTVTDGVHTSDVKRCPAEMNDYAAFVQEMDSIRDELFKEIDGWEDLPMEPGQTYPGPYEGDMPFAAEGSRVQSDADGFYDAGSFLVYGRKPKPRQWKAAELLASGSEDEYWSLLKATAWLAAEALTHSEGIELVEAEADGEALLETYWDVALKGRTGKAECPKKFSVDLTNPEEVHVMLALILMLGNSVRRKYDDADVWAKSSLLHNLDPKELRDGRR